MSAKRRLDLLLVEKGLAKSRQKAQTAILAGDVLVNGEPMLRQASSVPPDAHVELVRAPAYVGRGGEKLAGALKAFALDVRGAIALDAGASTGGFTDCLLQHGATRVYAVDVGYGQLDYGLREDPRVVVLERTNIRELTELPSPAGQANEAPGLATVDLSFIGLEKALPAIIRLLRPGGQIVALVKPQFQAKREEVGKGGVVKDPQVHAAVLGRIVAWAAARGLRFGGLAESPLRGPAGNREFFVLWTTPLDARPR
ncbi:MAG: TlyA family RNA methyltransferase [Chloroflexi bacterium]|nr:TlyA family RNA methyltransferase [Chloroflexota bacterium]MCH8065451.1 TlyA family RNA methyltransferase [Chloroflexota bacterium]